MPYIGNDIRANEDYKIIDDISSGFNGSATSFALQVGGSAPVPFPKFEQQLLISVNGVIQEPDPSGSAGFSLSGTNIVFSSAPTNGHAFFGVIFAGADYVNAGGTFPDGTNSVPSITFTTDTDTGIFRSGNGLVSVSSNGTKVATFPTAQGSSGQSLVTDGAGVLSFASPSGTTASSITVADESSDTTCFPLFATAATGDLGPKSGSNLTFNSSSGLLTATTFSGSGASLTTLNGSNISSGTVAAARVATLNQNTTGSAATLTTARNIGGVSFDGSANINLPGVNTAGNQNPSGAAAIATTITAGDESSDTTCFPVFTTAATGNLGPKTGSNLTFNSSSGLLTATTFEGAFNANGNNIKLGDSSSSNDDRLQIGAATNGDLELYHDGSSSYIDNITGDLFIRNTGDDITIQSNDDLTLSVQNGENAVVATGNAGVSMYYNNVKHFETSAYGVFVTGGANGNTTAHGGGTVTFDLSSSAYHFVNMNANSTFAAPINAQIGHSGSIFLTQDGTGSRTGSFNSAFKFVGGTAPTLSTAANAVDRLDFIVEDDSPLKVHVAVSLDVK